jgi:hypothetical protein
MKLKDLKAGKHIVQQQNGDITLVALTRNDKIVGVYEGKDASIFALHDLDENMISEYNDKSVIKVGQVDPFRLLGRPLAECVEWIWERTDTLYTRLYEELLRSPHEVTVEELAEAGYYSVSHKDCIIDMTLDGNFDLEFLGETNAYLLSKVSNIASLMSDTLRRFKHDKEQNNN